MGAVEAPVPRGTLHQARPARAKEGRCVGGLTLQVRENRRDLYIPCKMTMNNREWSRRWFYLRNNGKRLPAYTGKVLGDKLDDWG